MADLAHWWGNDLDVTPAGDMATIDGTDRGTQRIVRRLMTNLRAYIWHLDYGASLPQRVGETLDESVIAAVVRKQIFYEAAVAKAPPPDIAVAPILNGVNVAIRYTDQPTGQQINLNFDVNG